MIRLQVWLLHGFRCVTYFSMISMEDFCNVFCLKSQNLRKTLKKMPTVMAKKHLFPLSSKGIRLLSRHNCGRFLSLTSPYVFPLLAHSSGAHLGRLQFQIQEYWNLWWRASNLKVCSAIQVKAPGQSEAAQKFCPSKYAEQGARSTWIYRLLLRKKVKAWCSHN